MSTPGSGSLMQLLTNDNNSKIKNIAHEYYKYKSDGQTIEIKRIADIASLEYLEFILCDPYSNHMSDIKNMMLNFSIDNTLILQIPLNLLIQLNEPILCDNKMYIQLCFDMFFGDIILNAFTSSTSIKIEFNNTDIFQFISSYSIISKLSFYDTIDRRNLAQNPYEGYIQQITSYQVNVNLLDESETSDVFDIKSFIFNKITKGFFIECNCVDELNHLEIKLNDNQRMCFNRFLIKMKCKRISNQMIYFPFNYDMGYQNRTSNSYEGSPNMSRIDKTSILLHFDKPIQNIQIYALHLTSFLQQQGKFNCYLNIYDDRIYINKHKLYLYRNKKPIIKKFILDSNHSNCPISLNPIEIGDKYMSCHQCDNNFNEQVIQKWFDSQHIHTCPTCRVHWLNSDIYCNQKDNNEY
jgi:hypothetical protein